MNIPRGFIKDSDGVYKRGNYIFSKGEIVRESTLLATAESKEEITKRFTSQDEAERMILSYNSDVGNPTRDKNVFVNKDKDEYIISEKETNQTVSIITPDNNVYRLNVKDIKTMEDKDLATEDTVKVPEKEPETKPIDQEKVLTEASEDEEVTDETNEEPESEPSEEPVDDSKKETGSAYFIRRPSSLDELQDKTDKRLVTPATYTIIETNNVDESEYDKFASNMRSTFSPLKDFKPSDADTDFTVMEITCTDRPTLLIDNSGYDTAQYVAIK